MPTKKQIADAAARRNEEALSGIRPVPEGVLPGQIDMLDGSIAGSTEHVGMGLVAAHAIVDNLPAPPSKGPVAYPHIPTECTRCGRTMSVASGWTALKPPEDRKLQCGQCGEIIVVPRGAYDTLALALRRHFAAIDRYVPPVTPEKKTRGAG